MQTQKNGLPRRYQTAPVKAKPKTFGEDAGYELVTAKSESLQDGEFPKRSRMAMLMVLR